MAVLASTDTPPPSRFREAEDRSARIGRVLRMVGRVRTVDEKLMDRIGAGFWQADEVGGRLAQAIQQPAGSPGKVRMTDVREALEHGLSAVDAPPPALREFFETVSATPDWLDHDLLERGQRAYHRLGQNAGDVLLQLSLIGGYRFGGPTDLLVATGGLTGSKTVRRLAETQHWTTTLSRPGSLRPDEEAWRLTVHVRAMHALVNAGFESRWDDERWGLPINQTDQAATLGLFDGVVLVGVRALGVPISRDDSRAIMHMWKYVGWLMGVDDDFLVDSERERHRLNYHLLLAQADVSQAGPQLAQAIVDAQYDLEYDSNPLGLRGRFEQERLLSMLTAFLGRDSMRDLRLPLRPPWAHAYIVALNTLRYRTPWGRARLDTWGDAVRDRILRRYFGRDEHDVGALR